MPLNEDASQEVELTIEPTPPVRRSPDGQVVHDDDQARPRTDGEDPAGQADVLNEVMHILDREQRHDDVLRAMVHSASGHHVNRIARPDPDRVFHVDALRGLHEVPLAVPGRVALQG